MELIWWFALSRARGCLLELDWFNCVCWSWTLEFDVKNSVQRADRSCREGWRPQEDCKRSLEIWERPRANLSETFRWENVVFFYFRQGSVVQNFQVIMKQSMQVDESNLLVWQGLLVPDSAPYNKVPLEHVHYALWIVHNACKLPHDYSCHVIPFCNVGRFPPCRELSW